MDLFLSLYPTLLLSLTLMCFFPIGMPFTVIMSDSGVPSTLVDAPQMGFSNKNGARTDAKEQEAVHDIMKATGNSWATDIPDVCGGRWHGIECMPDKYNVFHIVSLSFGELSDDTAFPTCDPARSFISPSVTKLPHIRTLFFYRCFSDNPQPIPAFLGRLGPTLQTLVLRGNGHVGPIPDELGNLTRLKVLDLHENNLNGRIPVSLGQLTGLRSLDLSGNRLTGSVPNLTLPVLNILDLNQNHLVGPIPSTIGNCHSLLKIDFSRNRFSSPIPNSISDLENLVLLDLSYNLLTGPLPISLKNLNSLQALILKGNSMDSTIIPNDGFDGFKGLMILDLSEMNLHGPIPESLGYLTNLRVLHLDGNHLNGSIPKTFRDLINLSELRLNSNWLTGPVPFRREVVWRMRGKLRLYNNSGLCYDARNGFENGLDSLVESGIGYCETAKPTKTVLHFSTVDGEVERSSSQSSAPVYKCSNIPIMLIQLTTVLLFVLYLSY